MADPFGSSGRPGHGTGDPKLTPHDDLGLPPDAGRISRELTGTPFSGRIHALAEVESTNDSIRRLAGGGAPGGTVVIADRQTAGRGRRGRSWHSASGLGLYLSVLFRVPATAGPVTRWTLGAAVAACEACRELTGVSVGIKWPNDLFHGKRKLGGILTEMRTAGDRDAELVIGVGVNVGHRVEDLPQELAGQATSLTLLTCGRMLERETLAVAYLRGLTRVDECLRDDRWDVIAGDFERLAPACRAARVKVLVRKAGSEHEVYGVTCGIDPEGALLVRDAAGRMIVVRMADAVRPDED